MTPDVSTTHALAAAIRAMGPAHNAEILKATFALFKPLQQRAPRDGVTRHLDISYGEDERHRLDVYVPEVKASRKSPVVVYLHGGGLIGGERSPMPGLIYDNVATFFARHGCIGVNATYRLAPAHRWPSGAEDVGKIVAWLRGHAARYGGDPEKIVLIGQSAGASHVAAWTFLPRVHGSEGPQIAGAALLSGSFAIQHPTFNHAAPSPGQQAYYGSDPSAWPEMATLGHVQAGHPPVMLAVSQYDPYQFAWSSMALAAELLQCDRQPSRVHTFMDHNHVSPTMSINSEADTVGPELLQFVHQVTTTQGAPR
jgi:acetyl esterase